MHRFERCGPHPIAQGNASWARPIYLRPHTFLLSLVDDVLRFSSTFYFDKYLDSEKKYLNRTEFKFEQNIINRIKFKFEQISNLNIFHMRTNFKFEQVSNLNKIRI